MATIEEPIWMGGSFAVDDDTGAVRFLSTQSKWGKTSPTERLWHVHITFVINSHYTMVLPDARTVPKGGPLYHFVVTADPGVPFIRWVTNGLAGFVQYVPPISVRFYMADNAEQFAEDGIWCWKAQGYTFHTEGDTAYIASFGAQAGGVGAIDKYSVVAGAWSTEPDSGQSWYRAGVSWTGSRALIRSQDTVWSHTAGVTTFQNTGFANVDKCSFVRASGSGLGTRHYGFGNFDLASHVSDYYEFVGNNFTLVASNPAVGWNESSAAAKAGDQDVNSHYIIQLLQHSDGGTQLYPTWYFHINTAAYFAIQTTSVPHYAWGPAVLLQTRVHLLGGGSFHSNSFDVGTRWHHAYMANNLSGWIVRPWIPIPLRGHGCQFLPTRKGRRRCLFTMGKDHTFFPSDNALGWTYDDLTESFVVAGSSAWTDRREQNVSWGQLD